MVHYLGRFIYNDLIYINVKQGTRQRIGLFLGPLLFIIILLNRPESMSFAGAVVASVTIWMAVWWVSEAIPISATALLPIVLFPAFGAMKVGDVTAQYGHHIVFLMLGGFFIAIAMEKWNLHKRIALFVVHIIGIGPRRIIAGFMVATAFLSAWISNTSTAMVMMPIGTAVIANISTKDSDKNFNIALMLSIAYAASIGGMATLVGTPPNLIFAGIYQSMFGVQVNFFEWAYFGFPLAAVLLFITWFYLTHICYRIQKDEIPGSGEVIRTQMAGQGKITREEKHVLLVFGFVALSWMTRGLLWGEYLPQVSDASIAVAGALLLFLIPARKEPSLLSWEDTAKVPWGVAILMGGGFAIALGFAQTGLAEWVSQSFNFMAVMPVFLLILGTVAITKIFTEITSNTATATILMPIAASIAVSLNISPFGIMAAVAISSSLAFMMPVATPPNAIVFGSGYVTIHQMARAGLWLNLFTIVIVALFAFFMF
jgi:sodium-dependent dicarboxylate transporter 2/3/5